MGFPLDFSTLARGGDVGVAVAVGFGGLVTELAGWARARPQQRVVAPIRSHAVTHARFDYERREPRARARTDAVAVGAGQSFFSQLEPCACACACARVPCFPRPRLVRRLLPRVRPAAEVAG